MNSNQLYYAEAHYERPWWDKAVSFVIGMIMFIPLMIFFGIILPIYMKIFIKKGGEYNEN